MSLAGYAVRSARTADRPLIDRLLGELHGITEVARRNAWLYDRNPDGPGASWMAFDEASGEPIGITTFFPRRMVASGADVMGALGGDSYVRPQFRRRGIARELFLTAQRDMRKLGIELMFGTPLPANQTPLSSSGSRLEASTTRFATRPFIARALRLPRHLTLSPVSGLDPRLDRVWAETRPELGIASVRDAQFYRWRFLESPSQRQHPFVILDGSRPIAGCALESTGGRLRIIDLVAPQRVYGRALGAIAVHAGEHTAVEIKLCNEEGRRRRMWMHGFFRRERRPMSILVADWSLRAAELYDASRWHFSWADSDLDRA